MSEKKRILFVVEAMGGGIFTYVVELANQLAKVYDIYIAYAVRPQTPENFKDYFDSRIHLKEVKSFTRSIHPVKDMKAFFELRRIEKEISPHVIHLHSSKAGAIGRWAFNGRRIPLFYTPHGYSFLMSNYGFVKRLMFRTVEQLSAKRACVTISCSRGEYLESLKLGEKAVYVDNGINTEAMEDLVCQAGPETPHPFTVFTIGRICYQKNPALFGRIAGLLPDVHFLWIGDGELKEELNSPNIEITGWLERKEAIRRAMSADVFLLTSLWEGLPMSLLEAMYMKKLCVVSDVIGNRDVIHTGVNGYVCRKPEEFAAAIRAAREKPWGALIENAFGDIINHYNTVEMAKQYSAIYRDGMLAGTHAGGNFRHHHGNGLRAGHSSGPAHPLRGRGHAEADFKIHQK